MNRRDTMKALSAGAAAAVVAPVAARAGTNPDAELIALCARFDANERYYLSLFKGGSNHIEDDDERRVAVEPISAEQDEIAALIIQHRATTLEGFAAVARSLGLWDQQIGDPEDHGYITDQFVAMLVRDARGLA